VSTTYSQRVEADAVATLAQSRAMAHPDRLRIIRLTYDTPLTNAQLAQRLGRDPATVLHHVRTLVRTGFLVPQEPRRGARGAREIPYLSTGQSFRLQTPQPEEARAIDLAVVDAFRVELAEALELGPQTLGRLVVRLSPAGADALRRRLSELLIEAAAWEPVAGGGAYALLLALHEQVEG